MWPGVWEVKREQGSAPYREPPPDRIIPSAEPCGALWRPAAPDPMPTSADVTTLLVQAREGDRAALDRLMPLVYDELRRLARPRRAGGPGGDTLDTTGLVHDAARRRGAGTRVAWRDRGRFLAGASRAMRCVVVDHARARQAQKRGGAADPLPL